MLYGMSSDYVTCMSCDMSYVIMSMFVLFDKLSLLVLLPLSVHTPGAPRTRPESSSSSASIRNMHGVSHVHVPVSVSVLSSIV